MTRLFAKILSLIQLNNILITNKHGRYILLKYSEIKQLW